MVNLYDLLDEHAIRKIVLPKLKIVFDMNHSDNKIVANVLQCIERIMDKLEKAQVSAHGLAYAYAYYHKSDCFVNLY